MASEVFISHAPKDRGIAVTICNAIEQRGFACWLASRDAGPDTDSQESIGAAIAGAKAIVPVLSKHANTAEVVKTELAIAGQHGLTVIAVRVDDDPPDAAFADVLAKRQPIDMFGDWDKAIKGLASSLTAVLGAPSVAPKAREQAPSLVQTAAAEPLSRRLAIGLAAIVVPALAVCTAYWVSTPREPPSQPAAEGPRRRIMLRGMVADRPVTAELTRTSGPNWIWSEGNAEFTFTTVLESPTEILLHDKVRDRFHRLDLRQGKTYWRPGSETRWSAYYDIVDWE